tara:strand:- start:1087 stop:1338 length:252 start_codon:yes stop_codon:yes gene_type:complete
MVDIGGECKRTPSRVSLPEVASTFWIPYFHPKPLPLLLLAHYASFTGEETPLLNLKIRLRRIVINIAHSGDEIPFKLHFHPLF